MPTGPSSSRLSFLPRGGQHNQWYQCEKCQLGLRTIDSTHHQCPKCGTIYTGEPYDDVLFSRVHSRNLSGMHAAAWAWAITQDRKYAQHAARVLLGYAQRVSQLSLPYGRPKFQTGTYRRRPHRRANAR